MKPETSQKLDDLIILDAMSRAVLVPTLCASERAHLHHTHALCVRICPSWEWTLREYSSRLEAVRRDRTSSLILELWLSDFTLRWVGSLSGLPRGARAGRIVVQGASAMEVLLHLLVELTTPTEEPLPAPLTQGASDAG